MRFLIATTFCSVFCVSSFAFAQPPAADKDPTTKPGAAPAPTIGADAVEKARVHYERGLLLFNEENYDAALFEFERAYELAPSYKILYNMGRIQRQQNNYAAAMRSYSRYLREGGTGIPPERRAEVERELGVLKPRVAEITVKVNVDGANVYADDIPVCAATIESSCIGISPLREPIVVNGGRHKFTATKKGWSTASAIISVVGSDTSEVKLELTDLTPKEGRRANPWMVPVIAGWAATGLSLIGASITGSLSLGARDDQQALLKDPKFLGDPNATHGKDALADAREKTQTLAGVSDALFISSAVFAGASAYFTIKMVGFSRKEDARLKQQAFDVRLAPMGATGLAAVGTF